MSVLKIILLMISLLTYSSRCNSHWLGVSEEKIVAVQNDKIIELNNQSKMVEGSIKIPLHYHEDSAALIMTMNIDRESYNLVLDTGFNGDIALSRKQIKTKNYTEVSNEYKIGNRNWKYKFLKFRKLTFETDNSTSISFDDFYVMSIDNKEFDNMIKDSKKAFSGVVGIGMLSKLGYFVEINKENSFLLISNQSRNMDKYHMLDLHIEKKLIFIKNEFDKFLIDSGSSFSQLRKNDTYYTALIVDKKKYPGYYYSTDFKFDDYLKPRFVSFTFTENKHSILGAAFLKDFNYVIDLKSNKIYFEKIKTKE